MLTSGGRVKSPPAGTEKAMILETFTRAFVDAGALDASVAFYRAVLSGEQTLRFADPETGLELAAVSSPKRSVLIVAGPPEKRAPFEATRLTIEVDALEPFLAVLKAAGAEPLEPIRATPIGRKSRFRHPDGLVVKYVDHMASSAGRP
jgi:catechol 2,3-dioxygenase-like lactoylglutathione lyase family enzyme